MGRYECTITDGYCWLNYSVNVYFDTGLKWTAKPNNTRISLGEPFLAQASAESSIGSVEYKWVKWPDDNQAKTMSNTDTLTIAAVQKEDYERD